jgi:hemolysin activation/secretion protein
MCIVRGVRSRLGAARVLILSCLWIGGWAACGSADAQPAAQPGTQPTTAPSAPATGNAEAIPEFDRKAYPVSRFDVEYNVDHKYLPDLAGVMNLPIELGVAGDAYVVPPSREKKWAKIVLEAMLQPVPAQYDVRNIPTRSVTLNQLNDEQVDQFHASALWAIYDQIREHMNAKHILGVYVAADENDIAADETDRRPADRKALKVIIYAGVVKQVRTVGSGDRVAPEHRVDNPLHRRIREESPVKPSPPDDLLRRDVLDQYVYSLNRHPGRRVDVAVSAFEEQPGSVVLDYLVAEAKPWAVYVQGSNTGTEDTSEWRERFGFVHNQLTNNDDILTLDYITAGFTESHLVTASYEAPVMRSRKLRYRIYGLFSQFTASDVGQAEENFDGTQYEAGGELIYNIFQRRDFFIDLVGGARYERISVDNIDLDISGDAGFFVPYAGVRAQWLRDVWSVAGEVLLLGRFTGANQDDLNALGRFDSDENAIILQYSLNQSIFLEPLLMPKRFAEAKGTLAHELVLSLRGQWAMGNRLVPQAQEVIGGLYTVRGYDESVAAGDSGLVVSAEYRLHVPSLFNPQQPTKPFPMQLYGEKPFKWVPQQAYGKPDWDLILRAFVDAGWTWQSDPLPFEADQQLLGVGFGLELQIKHNFSLRLDWGFALEDLDDPSGALGDQDNRVHFSASFLY